MYRINTFSDANHPFQPQPLSNNGRSLLVTAAENQNSNDDYFSNGIDNDGEESVLSLACSKHYIFSGSQNPHIQVWDTKKLKCLYLIQSSHDIGDLFSVVYSDSLETLYIGCQNTSIQSFDLSVKDKYRTTQPLNACKNSKFFDAKPGDASVIADTESSTFTEECDDMKRYLIDESMIYLDSHNG
ncbi:14252_t:CDS:2, partial [Acaulospora colombiana]